MQGQPRGDELVIVRKVAERSRGEIKLTWRSLSRRCSLGELRSLCSWGSECLCFVCVFWRIETQTQAYLIPAARQRHSPQGEGPTHAHTRKIGQ